MRLNSLEVQVASASDSDPEAASAIGTQAGSAAPSQAGSATQCYCGSLTGRLEEMACLATDSVFFLMQFS